MNEKPRPKVLVVDDDQGVLSALQRTLHGLDVEVLLAGGPLEAIDLLSRHPIAVLITDYFMPVMNGIELLLRVRESFPHLQSIMLTATTDIRVAADAVNRDLVSYFITKPWDNENLLRLVSNLLDPPKQQPRVLVQPAADLGHREPSTAVVQETPLFGKYQVVERIAVGGMAELYRAKLSGAALFEKEVAIKKVLPHLAKDATFVQMFLEEAEVMSTLSHGNVVSVFDFGVANGEYFLVMEYVDGIDLRQLIDLPAHLPNPLPVPLACFIAHQICLGLEYIHQKRIHHDKPLEIVHRDINPRNVLVSNEGGVKIADFGIARHSQRQAASQAGLVKGTLGYMSPEQVEGHLIDHRVDIYAAGVILYELLTGRLPYRAGTHEETIAAIVKGAFTPPHKLDRAIDRRLSGVVERALAAKPKDRYQSAFDLGTAISEFLHREKLNPSAGDLAKLVGDRLVSQP